MLPISNIGTQSINICFGIQLKFDLSQIKINFAFVHCVLYERQTELHSCSMSSTLNFGALCERVSQNLKSITSTESAEEESNLVAHYDSLGNKFIVLLCFGNIIAFAFSRFLTLNLFSSKPIEQQMKKINGGKHCRLGILLTIL